MRDMTPERLAAVRREYAGGDYEQLVRMRLEARCGVPREEAFACSTAEDEAIWDSTVAEVDSSCAGKPELDLSS